MKCDTCRKRMNVTLGDADINMDGTTVKVINIPVFVCPNCEKRIIHDVIIKRAENYIHQYGMQGNSIDFGICEQKENEDAITTMQTLGIL